mgnify:CR=1 FL=1
MTRQATYTMHQCLGRGGFGEVYLATQSIGEVTKRVAVKVLRTTARNDNQALFRLRDEARMLAALEHPAILNVHELTRLAGRVALVTEYVEGVDIARCTKKERLLPARAAVGIMGEVAGALHCAWTTPSPMTGAPLHLIHRDIKPENVRLSKHGEVKLLDFGVARSRQIGREARTVTGDMPFTPGYAPPEAFLEEGEQGHHTDIFAWSVTLYRLLVGEKFYESLKLTEQINLAADPEGYRRYVEERLALVELEPLRDLLRGGLAYDPAQRPVAEEVESRCERMVDALDGLTYRRWAKKVDFPPPRSLDNAELTGSVLAEDDEAIQIDAPPVPEAIASVKPHTEPFVRPIPPSALPTVKRYPEPEEPQGIRWRLWISVTLFLLLCIAGVAALTMVFTMILSALLYQWM